MKRLCLIMAFSVVGAASNTSTFFDSAKAKKMLLNSGRYSLFAAGQVGVTKAGMVAGTELIKSASSGYNYSSAKAGFGLASIIGCATASVWAGMCLKNDQPVSSDMHSAGTTIQQTATSTNNGTTTATTYKFTPRKAILDHAINYGLFEMANFTRDPGFAIVCATLFAAKALICHSGLN